MSEARRKSSFQITSVSSGGAEPEGPGTTVEPRNGAGTASRFRVVKLAQGPAGEPYQRGRWTCLDVYEHEPEHAAVGRLLGATRLPRSLDSRLSPPLLRRAGAHGLPPGLGLARPALPRSLGGSERTPAGAALGHGAALEPGAGADELLLPECVARRVHREVEGRHQAPTHSSRPSSPAPPSFRDGSPIQKGSDPLGARLSLARSMFAMGGHQDSDDDSSGSSMIAIDNKIEQAMDLVKTHLMLAVREEVEVLREQIKELAERNAALEWENGLLRALASPEQLAQVQAQLRGPTA
ncbi:TSC22 domain family protein 4 isoform X2 [Carettochelys insculpta]|uniref:TSC22 domain family protein 4 isoform X2 n=1 Tax=Carettochelys insculpta TaxID=44489 RepID=UPI003EC15702